MTRVSVDIADFSRSIEGFLSNLEEKRAKTILQKIGDRYVKYLKNRYRSLSAGGGKWRKLSKATITKKARKGVANPTWILREEDHILNSISRRVKKKTVSVGIITNRKHPNSKKTIKWLVKHHASQGRDAIVAPTKKIEKDFTEIAQREVDKEVQDLNRK